MRAKGVSKPAELLRGLAAAGTPLNFRTLHKFLRDTPPPQLRVSPDVPPVPPVAPGAYQGYAEPAPPAGGVSPDALTDAIAAELETDDIARLQRVRNTIDRALKQWGERIGHEPSAVRAYATLSRAMSDVTAKLVEITPRADADTERLNALGAEKRRALLTRAREAAREDDGVRVQLARTRKVLDDLLEARGE
jgi:hypothetical protein